MPGAWDRFKERKLVQWTIAYGAFAWVALQLVETLGGMLEIPIVLQRAALVVLAFGFAVTLVLAWYHGDKGSQRVTGPELLILALLLVGVGVALRLVRDGEPSLPEQTAHATDPRSIAVLPFEDYSPEQNQEYLGDGIAEELLSTIIAIPGVSAPSRTSSFAFKNSGLDVRDIGARLGVATIVEGSVRLDERNLRITASIIDVADGRPRWSEQFDAELADIFSIQDQIARAVAEALQIRLTGQADELRLRGQTDDPVALDLYLRGRFEWNRRSEASLRRAVELFESALARDPYYARALIGLADAYAIMGFYDYRPPSAAFPLAQDAARRALDADPDLAAPHATLGYAALYYDWDWEQAERQFLRAIELDPLYAVAHQWYANYLVAMGRFEEAGREMRLASDLDPLSIIAHAATGWVYWYAGDNDRAVRQLDQTITQWPDFALAHLWRGQALESLGRLEESQRAIERAVSLSEGGAIMRAALARARALAGKTDEARQILQQLEDEGRTAYVPSYEIALVHVGLGNHGMAVSWLERAHDERAHSLAFLGVDPQVAPLARDTGYQSLLGELNLRTVVRP